MNCPKCGIPVDADAAFCPVCGEKLEAQAPEAAAPAEPVEAEAPVVEAAEDGPVIDMNVVGEKVSAIGSKIRSTYDGVMEKVMTGTEEPENKVFTKLPVLLALIGAALSFLVFVISWIAKGRICFYNYGLSGIGWTLAFSALAGGIALFIVGLCLRKNHVDKIKLRAILIGASIVLFIILMIASGIINAVYEKNHEDSYTPSYTPSLSSCHSTQEHILSIQFYDFDGNNSISALEMEMFINDHPRIGYDQGFINYFS